VRWAQSSVLSSGVEVLWTPFAGMSTRVRLIKPIGARHANAVRVEGFQPIARIMHHGLGTGG